MKTVDMNILIRFLTGDDEGQAKKVHAIFKKVESEKIFVLLLVILEAIWSHYVLSNRKSWTGMRLFFSVGTMDKQRSSTICSPQ